MNEKSTIFGRLQGRMFIRTKEKYYAVNEVEISGEIGGVQQQIIACYDVIDGRRVKFKLTGEMLMQPFTELVRAEQETGLRQILIINLDTGEWRIYPVTADLERRFPFLRDDIDYVV
jgi:hypothetical protein